MSTLVIIFFTASLYDELFPKYSTLHSYLATLYILLLLIVLKLFFLCFNYRK